VKQKSFPSFSVLLVQFSTWVAPLVSLRDNNAKRSKQCTPHAQFHNARFPWGSVSHTTSRFGTVAAPPTSTISFRSALHIIDVFMKGAGSSRSIQKHDKWWCGNQGAIHFPHEHNWAYWQ
jgi:hypothetical protein